MIKQLICSQTYCLLDEIHFVGDLEVRQDFLYLLGKLVRCEAHRVDVVGAARQCLRRSFKDLQGGPQAVIYSAQNENNEERR